MTVESALYGAESRASGVAWSAILGGAFGAAALSLILFPLGSALGFAAFSWHSSDTPIKELTLMSVVWIIIVQWAAAGFGGYLTGRLRTKWVGAHNDEVFFRDTVHGFLSWAVASVIGVILLASLVAPMVASNMQAGTERPTAAASNVSGESEARSRPGRRVNQEAEAPRTKMSAEEARKVAATASLFSCLALLIGAFVASVAGALGGRHRDLHYETGRLMEE